MAKPAPHSVRTVAYEELLAIVGESLAMKLVMAYSGRRLPAARAVLERRRLLAVRAEWERHTGISPHELAMKYAVPESRIHTWISQWRHEQRQELPPKPPGRTIRTL